MVKTLEWFDQLEWAIPFLASGAGVHDGPLVPQRWFIVAIKGARNNKKKR